VRAFSSGSPQAPVRRFQGVPRGGVRSAQADPVVSAVSPMVTRDDEPPRHRRRRHQRHEQTRCERASWLAGPSLRGSPVRENWRSVWGRRRDGGSHRGKSRGHREASGVLREDLAAGRSQQQEEEGRQGGARRKHHRAERGGGRGRSPNRRGGAEELSGGAAGVALLRGRRGHFVFVCVVFFRGAVTPPFVFNKVQKL